MSLLATGEKKFYWLKSYYNYVLAAFVGIDCISALNSGDLKFVLD